MAVMDLGKVVPEKGVDYFTEADVNQIVDATVQEAKSELKVSDFTNDAGYINKNVNDLTYYTLATATGSTIELTIDNATYEMTLNLKNSAGTVISTGSVDLPLETMVVGATYDSTNKKIVLTLKNGTTLDVPVGDLVNGLQAEITSTNKLSADLVDDSLGTNKFVTTAEKTAWNGKQDIIQYAVMPTADATTVGKIVQYIGETNNTYTNGYFYVGTNNGWENINVQDGGAAELEGFRNVDMAELGRIRTKYNKNSTVTPAMLYLEYGNALIRFVFENNDYAHIDSGKLGGGVISNFDVTNGSIAMISDDGRLFQALTNQGFTNKTFVCQFYSNDNAVVTVNTTYELVSSEIDNSSIAQNVNSLVKGDFNIQYSTMPTASADNLGNVVQYVGGTDNTYTNGYFYKCVSDGDEEEPTYSWKQINVQNAVKKPAYLESYGFGSRTIQLDQMDTGIMVFGNNKETQALTIKANANDTGSWIQYYGLAYLIYNLKISATLSNNTEIGALITIDLGANSSEIGFTVFRLKYSNNKITYSMYRYHRDFVDIINAQTITGKKTFNTLPESSVTPTTANQLVNKAYVDGLVGNINTVLATLTTPTSNGGE